MNQDSVTIVVYPDKLIIRCNEAQQEIHFIDSLCSSSCNIYFS